jgi:hypothetical protein
MKSRRKKVTSLRSEFVYRQTAERLAKQLAEAYGCLAGWKTLFNAAKAEAEAAIPGEPTRNNVNTGWVVSIDGVPVEDL